MRAELDCHIAVFTKPSVAGQVKTRLIPALGAQGAARLHARMLRHTLAVVRDARAASQSLWIAGEASDPMLQTYAAQFPLYSQQGRDLGIRMAAAFDTLLRQHARVLLVGTDCPPLAPAHLRASAKRLDSRHDVVLVPAEDGGYVLLGLAAVPVSRREALFGALFDDIPWGSAEVLVQTRARLARRGLSWAELPPLWDIDRPEDLQRLMKFEPSFFQDMETP